MVTFEQAYVAVLEHINAHFNEPDDELVIVDDYTTERPYGWVFVYNSRTYLETEDFTYAIIGGPVVVERETGTIYQLGTAQDFDEELRQFEQWWFSQ